jgi:carboxypeptidase C (cathepsin A)/predicted phosphodiesterase
MRRTLRCCSTLLAALACWAAEPASDFRFSIVGDRTGGARQGVYARVWEEVDGFRPDFVINVGDTVEGTSDETAEAQWKEIRGFLDRYKRYPFYLVPGNHDIWSSLSQKLFEAQNGRPATYSFDYQNAHFVVLDTSRSPELGADQLQFLQEDLKKNRDRDPTFVFFHHPSWLALVKVQSRAFALHRIAREYGVDYVISGHGHQFIRMALDGITYMEVGSSGADIGEVWTQDGAFSKGRFYHHVQVQVKGSQAQLRVKEVDAPFGKGRSFRAENWGDSGPGTSPPVAPEAALRAPIVTRHTGRFNGREVAYTATVSEIEVADAAGKPGARVVTTAYVAEGIADSVRRPVLFLFNGGPIVPSIYLHMGSFGPKRVAFPDDVKADPSTFRTVENPYSLLDTADLVFFDPAGTGYSRPAPGKKLEEYFSVKADGQQTAAFMVAWLKQNGRLASPKYVLGESYGTVRAPELGRQLAEMAEPILLDGMILLGQAVNIIEYSQRPGNIVSYVVSLPTLAAIAWYHGKVDRKSFTFEQFHDAARTYSRTDYLTALFQGNTLPPEEKAKVAARLEAFSGLSAEYYLAHDLRITKNEYRVELFRKEGLVLGLNDGRYIAPRTEKGGAVDPSDVLPQAVAKAFEEYRRDDLKVTWSDPYQTSVNVKGLDTWGWGATTPFSDWPYGSSISLVMEKNPHFRLMVATGYYDTQTTTGAAEYAVTQADWPKDRVWLKLYEGGHMCYSVEATARQMANDLRAFMQSGR